MFALKNTVTGEAKILGDLTQIRRKMQTVFDNAVEYQSIIVASVELTMMAESTPDGQPWPDLSDSYAAWKQGVAPGALMGVLYGSMCDPLNLAGAAFGQGNQLTVTYGVDPVAIEHAIKFTEGGLITGTMQPPRPFWGLSPGGEAEVTRTILAHMA